MSKVFAIVFFDKMNKGLAYGTYKGRPVYQHRDHEGKIGLGTLWIVSLEERVPSVPFFAVPIREAGVDDILGLDNDNVKAVAECLIKEYSESVAEILGKSGRTVMSIENEGPEDHGVRYMGDGTLESYRFADGYYDVSVSVDNTVLMIIPRNSGRIPCVGHRMVLEGLDNIVHSGKGEELAVEAFDGFLVIDLREGTVA